MNEQEMFADALVFATNKHKGQYRKDGVTPYIYHPIAVANLVRIAGGSLKAQIVALLHDVLEDTDTTVDEIKKYGDDVCEAVELLTRKETDEASYVEKILQNHIAATVKNADKICNLQDAAIYLWSVDKEQRPAVRQFVLKYHKKADTYYKGKFSPALDKTIGAIKYVLCTENGYTGMSYYNYPNKELELHQDINTRLYTEAKAAYNPILRPNFTNNTIKYCNYTLCGPRYYCWYTENGIEQKWTLTEAGWKKCPQTPYDWEEYGDYIAGANRESILTFIKDHKDWFYDFVDLNTL